MTNTEIKDWSKKKIKENFWPLVAALLVAGLLTNLSIGKTTIDEEGMKANYTFFGWIFYFVKVGITYYMVKFVTNQKVEFKDIFAFSKDFGRDLGAGLLQALFVFLWALLFIVPGIMKAFSYALVPYLLADDKYRDLSIMDILKRSEEMMHGHRMDYFLFALSFIGWHFLSLFTLGLLELWIIPYQQTALTKYLNDLKTGIEGPSNVEELNSNTKSNHFCTECGTKVENDDIHFCPNCGKELKKES